MCPQALTVLRDSEAGGPLLAADPSVLVTITYTDTQTDRQLLL